MRPSLLCVALLVPCSALASPDPLTPADIALEGAYTVLHVMDWNQTRAIAARPRDFHEKNLVLGEHPSGARVDRYFASTLAAHWAITYALPEGWRKPWIGLGIAVEATVVRRNYMIGLSARF